MTDTPSIHHRRRCRRWTKLPYPDANGEVLVLAFSQEGQPARYLTIPLGEDLNIVLMQKKRLTRLQFAAPWSSLPLEPSL